MVLGLLINPHPNKFIRLKILSMRFILNFLLILSNPLIFNQFRTLHNVLFKNQTVTEQNKHLLVETLRSIAEILIWGDQNDSTVFE